MSEIHLLIIWSKGLYKKEEIISDIKEKFDILKIYNIEWSLERFSENLSRLYGENLPKNSGKERHCGNGIFSCIVIRDNNPTYEQRETSKGPKVVNINTFDKKQLYRKWTGGGHKIHATDDTNETKFQLSLLFGHSYEEYFNYKINYDELIYKHDLMGANCWLSFEELFSVLNNSMSNYVVLRNFDNLEEQLNSTHPDIDLLVENKKVLVNILNAKPTTDKTYRVQYSVMVEDKNINFDLRYVGDNYYDPLWQMDILSNKIKYGYCYVPNNNILLYSLIYHALVHKNNISSDYLKVFIELFEKENIPYSMQDFVEENLLDILLKYMRGKAYQIVEPNDLTVGFNTKLISKKINFKISKERKYLIIYLQYRSLIRVFLKKIINKVKI